MARKQTEEFQKEIKELKERLESSYTCTIDDNRCLVYKRLQKENEELKKKITELQEPDKCECGRLIATEWTCKCGNGVDIRRE